MNHQIHESLVTALWGFDQENQQMAYTAAKDIAEGEEIFTHYGDRGTTALLTNYGFTAGGNPYDFTGLCLAPEKDATEEDKTAMLTAIYNYGNPFDTACASRLPMDSPNGGSCNLVRDVLSEDSHKCWQFARIASAEPEQVSRLMEKHNADVTARENMDEEELAAYEWSVLDTEWSDYENELRALGFLANSAVFQHALIPGGSTAEDAAQLQAHEAATAGKQCQGDASTHAPAWYPAGPCLTSSQVNLVRLRASEKFPLENLIKLHEVALEFNILQPTTAAAAYEFLNSPHVVYSPAEKDSLSRNGLIEQDFSLPRRYLNDILIPAYVQLRGLPEEAQADVKTEL